MKIQLGNTDLACNIMYANCKKITINIENSGFITVKAPKNLTEQQIKKVLLKNENLIKDKLDQITKHKECFKEKQYNMQGKFPYLGSEYTINELLSIEEIDSLAPEEVKMRLKAFYSKNLKKIILERIIQYEKLLNVKASSFAIVDSKNEWGSCNIQRKLTFHYRLAMAPIDVIDYVIVHELCHILHMNHDRSFWRKVGGILPDYKHKENYLAQFGMYMLL